VTLCKKGREWILSRIVGPDALIGPIPELTEYGQIVDKVIQNTSCAYDNITIPKYVIMPNHIHILLMIHSDTGGPMRASGPTTGDSPMRASGPTTGDGPMPSSGPTLGMVVRAIKTLTTRQIGETIWQNKFHDHIIRDDNDFLGYWQYIDGNPAKWADDEYYRL
jgi:REP element-mobilizing transposase RayT